MTEIFNSFASGTQHFLNGTMHVVVSTFTAPKELWKDRHELPDKLSFVVHQPRHAAIALKQSITSSCHEDPTNCAGVIFGNVALIGLGPLLELLAEGAALTKGLVTTNEVLHSTSLANEAIEGAHNQSGEYQQ